jgi:excisionase family DNA binding protein
MEHEHFVSASVAAEFLGISEAFIIKLARNNQIPAYPLPTTGRNSLRRTWRFRLSELREFMERGQ